MNCSLFLGAPGRPGGLLSEDNDTVGGSWQYSAAAMTISCLENRRAERRRASAPSILKAPFAALLDGQQQKLLLAAVVQPAAIPIVLYQSSAHSAQASQQRRSIRANPAGQLRTGLPHPSASSSRPGRTHLHLVRLTEHEPGATFRRYQNRGAGIQSGIHFGELDRL